MSKAFWEGFRIGFINSSKHGIPIAVALAIGLILGSWSHPYEQCKRKYEDPNDIMECAWILEHD